MNFSDPITFTDEELKNYGKRDFSDKLCLIQDKDPSCPFCGRREHFVRFEEGKEPLCITEPNN